MSVSFAIGEMETPVFILLMLGTFTAHLERRLGRLGRASVPYSLRCSLDSRSDLGATRAGKSQNVARTLEI
jgi:hypothetical protein